MIPAQITSDLALLSASVQDAAPIKTATPLRKAALVSAGLALVTEIDTGLAGAVGSLDAADPAGYAGDLVTALMGLATAAYDQATLADMRGTVGRAVFNLSVATGTALTKPSQNRPLPAPLAIPAIPVQPAPVPAPVVVLPTISVPAPVVVLPTISAPAADFTIASNSGLIAAIAA